MPFATYEVRGGDVPVGVLTLNDGKMNSFDFAAIEEVNAALDQAERDDTRGLVIAGTAKALSAGFDLKIMAPVLGRPGAKEPAVELVEKGGRLMVRVFAFPKPVVIAATGHSLALGAILLLAGDVRIGRAGPQAKVGLNETAIGMQLPAFGWRMAQYRLATTECTKAITQATVYDTAAAARMGFLDSVVDGDVVEAALAEARRLGAYVKQPAYARTKREERAAVIAAILGNIKEDVLACFPETPSKL
mmetsp:Transcript_39769/g.112411  ORF Transcript_39769/g.112411 Transcript_39769/m.112411 type:complete len:247 (-) Transcript_39769:53-793(-)